MAPGQEAALSADIAAILVALIDASSRAAREGNQGSALADVTRLAAAATAVVEGGVNRTDSHRAAALLHLLRHFGYVRR